MYTFFSLRETQCFSTKMDINSQSLHCYIDQYLKWQQPSCV